MHPCGGFRQKIREFGGADTRALVVRPGRAKAKEELTLGELLPEPFGPDNLA